MAYQILVETEFTAANTDCLSATELATPPADGTLYLWACSTVNTATLEVPQPFHQPGITATLRLRTNGIPSSRDDPPFILSVVKGKRPTIVLAGTTGTVHMTAQFIGR